MEDLLISAALQSNFYKKKLSNVNVREWSKIPLTTKQELRDADPYDLLGTAIQNIATYHETSGTTGKPSPSWFSFDDVDIEAKFTVESHLRLTEDDLVLNRFPFALAIPSFILYWACQLSRAAHIAASKSSLLTPHMRVIEIIERVQPTVITFIPAEAEIIGTLARSLNIPLPTKNLRCLVLGGEVVSPKRKKYIESLWGVPAFASFGSTETGGLFMTCHHGNYHMKNPIAKVEILDEEGRNVPLGEKGEFAISIAREGMPLLRYANGDMAEIREATSCTCGSAYPVLVHYGRKSDHIFLKNRTLSLYELQDIVYSLPYVPMLWRAQVYPDQIKFHYQMFGMEKTEDMRICLEGELRKHLGVDVSVNFTELVDEADLTSVPHYSKFHYVEHFTHVLV
ncbi:phenylacetate--CoA ligase family protein [Mesobacillus foraminis]|uniref:phenylacetate--CoA ligase family protein n=1 Tax=Mesobacillus foraminis TaxID=279826 RepID=UPI0013CE72BC|nr:AMP-binding protein [Mesobacillus foraminis]